MSGFCPHDWHQTTETDLQHMALGSGDYEYAVWEAMNAIPVHMGDRLEMKKAAQKVVTDKAYALAAERGLIPYSEATFLSLMDEVEALIEGEPKP